MTSLAAPWKVATLLSANGSAKIRVATYCPEGKKIDRWFVFANGRSEYVEKYPNLPIELGLKKNVGFLTWDHQGQGKSSGHRSHIDSYDTFAEDCELVIRKYVGGAPFTLCGHSMGALIALYTVMKRDIRPEALVLCSPLLKVPPRPFPPVVTKKISTVATLSGFGRVSTGVGKYSPDDPFVGNRYTHCKATYDHIKRNPFHCPGASFGWVRATQDAIDFVYRKSSIKKLKVPVEIVGGSKEEVVDLSGWREWTMAAQKYLKQKVEYRLIPKARHELFSEIDLYKNKAIQSIREFTPESFAQ